MSMGQVEETLVAFVGGCVGEKTPLLREPTLESRDEGLALIAKAGSSCKVISAQTFRALGRSGAVVIRQGDAKKNARGRWSRRVREALARVLGTMS